MFAPPFAGKTKEIEQKYYTVENNNFQQKIKIKYVILIDCECVFNKIMLKNDIKWYIIHKMQMAFV